MNGLSVFSIVKNEAQFIGYGVMSVLDHVGEIVYADGNSTDGTLETLEHIKRKYDKQDKIKILRGMDCKDFKDDYMRLFNDLMKQCKGNYLWYLHPDMIVTDLGKIKEIGNHEEFARYVNVRSFAGEDMGLEITKGRTNKWKSIMVNDFGLHYWGYYGDPAEDMYFSDITGNEHSLYPDFRGYPYDVLDSGIKINHYCECKPRQRRKEKMVNVLETNFCTDRESAESMAIQHPRVHLESQESQYGTFEFVRATEPLPDVFLRYKPEFDYVLGRQAA